MEPRLLEVAGRLKQARLLKGATLDDAAQTMCVNKNTINRCETGKQVPDVSYLFAFEKFSKRSVAWILTGSDVDESSFSLKERQYQNLVEVVATVLAQTLAEKGVTIKWQYYGKVMRMLFKLSLEFVHEGSISLDFDDTSRLQHEIETELQKEIENLFVFITEDIFE